MTDDQNPAEAPVPRFEPHQRVCGNCLLWRAHSIDVTRGWVGNCRLQANRGLFPPSAPICDTFAARGGVHPASPARPAPAARAKAVPSIAPTVRNAQGAIVSAPAGRTVIPSASPNAPVDLEGEAMTRQELMNLFLEASGLVDVPLAPRWEGGTIKLIPGNNSQEKELPLDALFHKVVMIRDRLRTLEQKLNANPKLTDTEKVELQQYVTRCYGSLTTFNVLFKDKADQFVGEASSDKE